MTNIDINKPYVTFGGGAVVIAHTDGPDTETPVAAWFDQTREDEWAITSYGPAGRHPRSVRYDLVPASQHTTTERGLSVTFRVDPDLPDKFQMGLTDSKEPGAFRVCDVTLDDLRNIITAAANCTGGEHLPEPIHTAIDTYNETGDVPWAERCINDFARYVTNLYPADPVTLLDGTKKIQAEFVPGEPKAEDSEDLIRLTLTGGNDKAVFEINKVSGRALGMSLLMWGQE